MITHEMEREEGARSPEAEELAQLYAQSLKDLQEGQILKGRIIAITEKGIVVDVGYKSEGILALDEFPDPQALQVGDEVEVLLESVEDEEGLMVLSRKKAERAQAWERLMATANEGDLTEGRVSRKVKGGLMVDLGGVEAFLPASQAFLRGFGNVDSLIGQTAQFIIIKINRPRRNVVVSRREALAKEKEAQKLKVFAELEVGQVRQGTVKNITDFGAFVNLGGVDGLLHITDLSWGRVGHPSEVVQVGQKISVQVLGFDRETMKISLGFKQLTPNPWDTAEQKYPVGSRIHGRVVSLMPYGAFVEAEKGLEGLVHISELSWTKRPSHPSEVLKVGDEIEVAVLSVDRANQKMALGLKQTEANPWEIFAAQYPLGTRLSGRVKHLTDFGAFVELADGVDGLLHVQDLSWTRRYNHPSEVLKKGQKVDVMIMSVDPESRKIGLGYKQLMPDPWSDIVSRYPSGTLVEGKITKIANFGLFVELEKDLDGLVHLSELPVRLPDRPAAAPAEEGARTKEGVVAKLEAMFTVGDSVKAKVLRLDDEQRRIALSMRRVE
ncbi:MAG: 30S ribosomal protein S1 [Candidatus Omnitrophica bacterium]|nr:30S ribosomal protein S1 [Candidatus Omnitrophota bacterium]